MEKSWHLDSGRGLNCGQKNIIIWVNRAFEIVAWHSKTEVPEDIQHDIKWQCLLIQPQKNQLDTEHYLSHLYSGIIFAVFFVKGILARKI